MKKYENTNAFLADTVVIAEFEGAFPIRIQKNRPRVICEDGFSVSIQASENHYCDPRVNGRNDYETVELGYPSIAVDEFLDYAEDPESPTDTVYGCVPVEIVDSVLEKHGGITDVKNRED